MMIGRNTVLMGVFALHLLCSAARAQGLTSNGTLSETDLDGMIVPVLLCGPKIVARNSSTNFEQRVLNTGADPANRVVYYSTYTSFEPMFRMGPLYAPDAVSYAVACSANVPKKTIGNILWLTNVTTLPDNHQDGLGRGLRLLPNATALISFERASYNGTLTSGVFLSSHFAILDAKTGSKISRLPIDPANPDKLLQVPVNILRTSNNLNVFMASDRVSRQPLIWPGQVQVSPNASIYPPDLLQTQYSTASSKSSIVYDTVVTKFGQFEFIDQNGSLVSEGVPGVLTVIAINALTGKLEKRINLTTSDPISRSLSVDKLSGDVFVTGRRRYNKVTLTRLNSNANGVIWNQNYTAQLLDSNATARLYLCGSTYVKESRRVVMAFEISYPTRNPVPANGAVAKENPRVSVTRDSSDGTKETFPANPIPETANQRSQGVNTRDILVLVVEGSTGQLVSARIVGTPFVDVCKSVEYAGDGVLALFGNFPTVYVNPVYVNPQSSQREPSQYPVLFDVTDAGTNIGGSSKTNQTKGTY